LHRFLLLQPSFWNVSETWGCLKGLSTVCTLIAYYQIVPTYPIVVAANRDEHYTRKARGPHVIHQPPRVYAGQDAQAGGTWLGVNEFGLVVGLLNRHSPQPQHPTRRSRGLLCLDLLCQRDARTAGDLLVTATKSQSYNSFYIFWADSEHAYVAYNEEGLTIRALQPGRYLLTNSSLIDLSQLTPTGLGDLLTDPQPMSLETSLVELKAVCRTHREIDRVVDPPNEHRGNRAICVHTAEQYGTVSSSLLAIGRDWSTNRYLHAEGAPCCTPYQDVSGLFTDSERSNHADDYTGLHR
jgi:transport and Golgi organization protein 2